MNTRFLPHIALLLSVCSFIACLPMYSFCLAGDGCDSFRSYNVLIWGWISLPLGKWHLLWLANPALFLSWALIAGAIYSRARTMIAIATLGAACTFAFAASFLSGAEIVNNEGGVAVRVSGYAAGYWLWLLSMMLAVLSAVLTTPDDDHWRANLQQ
jgi:hypothetical protein